MAVRLGFQVALCNLQILGAYICESKILYVYDFIVLSINVHSPFYTGSNCLLKGNYRSPQRFRNQQGQL